MAHFNTSDQRNSWIYISNITLCLGDYFYDALWSGTAPFIIMVELTGEGTACIPVGLTKTWDGLVNWTKCVW